MPSSVSLLFLLLLSGDISLNPGPDIPFSAANNPVLGSANICGLRQKVLQLQAEYLSPYNFAAFALQETKLSSSCRDPNLQIADYTLFRRDRKANGGGVALYVQDSLNARRFRSSVPAALELLAIEAYFGSRRLILASLYLPPRARAEMEDRVSDLADWLALLGPSVADLVLFGDFNPCPLDGREVWQWNLLSNLCRTFGLSQIVTQPTHGTRLLDHCLVGDPLTVAQYGLGFTLERKTGQIGWPFCRLDATATSQSAKTQTSRH